METPRIVYADARPSVWLWLVLLAVLAAWTWLVYEFGLQYPHYASGALASDDASLHQRIDELERERDELQLLAAKYERASQIDREATQAIQAKIKALRDQRSELAREAAHLRGLVSDGDTSFVVDDYSLRRLGDDFHYAYTFTLSRDVEGAKKVEGTLKVKVNGQMKGETVELSMAQLAPGAAAGHKLGFKQFQKIEGRLELPSGFAPSELIIDVNLTSPKERAFVNAFDWVWTEG